MSFELSSSISSFEGALGGATLGILEMPLGFDLGAEEVEGEREEADEGFSRSRFGLFVFL